MSSLDINNASYTDFQNVPKDTSTDNYAQVVASQTTDGVSDADETEYVNTIWTQNYGYFLSHPELKAAIIMKAIWNVGKGYTCDNATKAILDRINGFGKDTFDDILFNMEITRRVGRDAIAEIVRNEETGTLLDLKVLDPASIRWFVDRKGKIIRYEQFNKNEKKGKAFQTFKPEQIFHLSNNRIADNIHGISDIESLDKTLLAEIENFDDVKKVMHRQVLPLILWKLRTDDDAKISAFIDKLQRVRNKTEELVIPDDENLVSWEVVKVDISQSIFQWRNEIRNKFYRALGLPQIIFGQAGGTESGSKIEYLAHEQVFERDQRYLEKQIWAQLGLRINLIPPVSLLENLQTDEAKDAGAAAGMQIKPSELTAGAAG